MARLIDPRIARAVARRVAGDSPGGDSYLMGRLERDLDSAVPRSEALVAEASGIPVPPPVRWGLIDRAAWVEVNIAGLTQLLAPIAAKVERRLGHQHMAARLAQRGLVSAEVGVLLGYVSRRVLGQYDLLVPEKPVEQRRTLAIAGGRRGRAREPADGASLLFVGPNIVDFERRFGFVPEDFALWVCVHEVTHRFQFAGVPWLRPHFFELVESYLESHELDAAALSARLRSAAVRLASRATPAGERNPIYLLATEEQRRQLDRIQALMAVVEGHGNYVMDTVGAAVIPSFRRMRGVFERRREQTTALQRAINHAIGLEMKLRQYEMGQRFCNGVAALEGPAAFRHLWAAPENLPSLAELEEPSRWLRRVA